MHSTMATRTALAVGVVTLASLAIVAWRNSLLGRCRRLCAILSPEPAGWQGRVSRISGSVLRLVRISSSGMQDALQRELAEKKELRSTSTSTIADASSGVQDVPVIDLSLPDAAGRVWDAAAAYGFFTVTGHGIDPSLIDHAFSVSSDFFALGRAFNEQQSLRNPATNSGYDYMQVRPATGLADQKEALDVRTSEQAMAGIWPTEPPALQRTVRALSRAAHGLACRLMSMLEAQACPHEPPGTLEAAHNIWVDESQCVLKLLHYPPPQRLPPHTEQEEDAGFAVGSTRLWRIQAHTDWTTLTLLFQRPGQDGLECSHNPRRALNDTYKRGWVNAPPIAGGITVNIGDMLAKWSTEPHAGLPRLYSNLHRVRMPTGEAASKPRYSIAFFAQADKTALIRPQGQPPITGAEYIAQRIKKTHVDGKG